MKHLINSVAIVLMTSCTSQGQPSTTENNDNFEAESKIKSYISEHPDDSLPSKSHGTAGNGYLENGKLIPFEGKNYQYFDTASYLSGRAFLNDQVKATILDTYASCDVKIPDRKFYIMECSNQNGGKIWPHKTHQNGLSVDLMMPLIKDNQPYYGLDTKGISHYLLEFDYEGKYLEDPSISIDFEVIAQHLLLLEENAQKNGLHISKVIIHTELKDELYADKFGQQLKNSNIYVVKALTPLINALHDDHYHVDFEKIQN